MKKVLPAILTIVLILAFARSVPAAGVTYIVKPGDSLSGLALNYLGNRQAAGEIIKATNARHGDDPGYGFIKDPNRLRNGQKLVLPLPVPGGGNLDAVILDRNLNFPEAPFWSKKDGCLYYVEWGGDKMWKYKDGQKSLFLENAKGDGPCGMDQAENGDLWVAMYSSLKVVRMDGQGKVLATYDNYNGAEFRGPNDVAVDARGGVYFTDSGNFEDDWATGRPAGALYYITPEGRLTLVDSRLCYSNGLSLSLDGKRLYVNEHRKNRVLAYGVRPDGSLSKREVFFRLDNNCLAEDQYAYELGPDGMCRDSHGNLWVAHYRGGKVVVISPEGKMLRQVYLPEGFNPTNTSLSPDEKTLYVSEGELGYIYALPVD